MRRSGVRLPSAPPAVSAAFHLPHRSRLIPVYPRVPESDLLHLPFVLDWSARTCAARRYQMLGVAVAWQMYALTGSALHLGLIGLMQFLPAAALMLVAGQSPTATPPLPAADLPGGRESPRLVWPSSSSSGWVTRELILAAVLVLGIGRAFEAPTQQTPPPAVVPASLFPRAVAASASTTQLATISGPALGAVRYIFGAAVPYATASSSTSSRSSCWASCAPSGSRGAPLRQPAAFFAGVSLIRRSPIVLGVISLDLFAVLLAAPPRCCRSSPTRCSTRPGGRPVARSTCGRPRSPSWRRSRPFPLRRQVGRIMFVPASPARPRDHRVRAVELDRASWPHLPCRSIHAVSVVIRMTPLRSRRRTRCGRFNAVNSLFAGTSTSSAISAPASWRPAWEPSRRFSLAASAPAGGADLDASLSGAQAGRQLLYEENLILEATRRPSCLSGRWPKVRVDVTVRAPDRPRCRHRGLLGVLISMQAVPALVHGFLRGRADFDGVSLLDSGHDERTDQ